VNRIVYVRVAESDDYGNGIDGADDGGVGVTQRRKNASSANRMSE